MPEKHPPYLRYLAFWLTALLLFCLLQVFFLPRGEVLRWRTFYAVPQDTIDVVFLGTSHAYHSFNPEVIDEIIPIRSHSLGIPGDSIQTTYHEIQSILRRQQPKLILIDGFSLFMSHWLDGPYVFRFLNSSFDPATMLSAVDILFKNDYLWWNYFPMSRNHTDWQNPEKLLKNPFSNTPPEYAENPKGHAPLTTIITDADYASIPMEEFLPLPDHYLEYLQKVIDTSRAENFDLVFADTLWRGFSNPVYDLYDRSAELRLLSKENIDYYDFRTYPLAYGWQQLHMYDRDHPSEFGSLIISVKTAQLLAERLQLPLDEEALAYYQNFFFTGHTVTSTRGQTTFTLIPENPSAPLLYRWRLMDAAMQPLQSLPAGSDPAFSFAAPSAGTYYVGVAITQPGGEYELEGIFTYIVE